MTDIVKLRSDGQGDKFSFVRFAEWKPQTLSAEITVEILSLAQFLKDEYFTPIYFNLWLEITAVTIKNLEKISKQIEELLDNSLSSAKSNFRKFPPTTESFGLTLHLMFFDNNNNRLEIIEEKWTANELLSAINRGFAWDIQKRINSSYKEHLVKNWDNAQWNLDMSLHSIFSTISQDDDSQYINFHGILLSGWHTTGSYDQLIESNLDVPLDFPELKLSIFTLTPANQYINAVSKALNFNYNYFLAENFIQTINLWNRKLSNNIEPKLEVEIEPNEEWGQSFSVATNAALFQDVIIKDRCLTFYNLKSIRYPIRINFKFDLPAQALENQVDAFNPIVWDDLALRVKTASNQIIKVENLLIGKTYRLFQNDLEYQPERELNERIRLADSLKYRLEQLLIVQTEVAETIKQLIAEPQLISQDQDKYHSLISSSLADLNLAFEILDHLAEEELLLAEIPPTSKMFRPPKEDILNI